MSPVRVGNLTLRATRRMVAMWSQVRAVVARPGVWRHALFWPLCIQSTRFKIWCSGGGQLLENLMYVDTAAVDITAAQTRAGLPLRRGSIHPRTSDCWCLPAACAALRRYLACSVAARPETKYARLRGIGSPPSARRRGRTGPSSGWARRWSRTPGCRRTRVGVGIDGIHDDGDLALVTGVDQLLHALDAA
jgi:hypothetical protein